MTRFEKFRALRWVRRVSQGFFLLLFFYLLLQTNIDSMGSPDALPEISAPVGFFLEIDPLIAVGSIITTGVLYRNLLWAVVLVIATLFLGRFFCGWVCPLGTISHMTSAIPNKRLRGIKRLESNAYKPYQKWKYIILAVFLGASLFTSLQVGLLDPVAVLTRAMALAFLPAWNVLTQDIYAGLLVADAGSFQPVLNVLSASVKAVMIRVQHVRFEGALLAASVFLFALVANRFITRFWCRGICPLGALLGIFSKVSVLGLEKNASACTGCNKCAMSCQGADNPKPGLDWHKTECHLCLNCVAECPEAGIEFRFFPDRKETTQAIDVGRRTAFAAAGAGLAAIPLLRVAVPPGRSFHSSLVRPPGAVAEKDFLSRCVRCGECMNVCPNNALHPTLMQAGIEGIWSPVLLPRIGYCEPTCVLCGQVCPTGAIDEITEIEKAWVPRTDGGENRAPISIGTAFYDFGRCLPWAMGTECIVCEEWCPTTPKSIYFIEAEVQKRNGDYVYLKQPHVDPALCIGCGACTYACPVKGAPAIYIASVGETRNPLNRILLDRPKPPRPEEEG